MANRLGFSNGSDVTGPNTPYWRPISSPPTNTQMLRNSANKMAAVAAGGPIHVRPCLTTNRRPAFAAGGRMPSTTNDFMNSMLRTSPSTSTLSYSVPACRVCSGTFGSNNSLHRHLRASHGSPTPRRPADGAIGIVASGRSWYGEGGNVTSIQGVPTYPYHCR